MSKLFKSVTGLAIFIVAAGFIALFLARATIPGTIASKLSKQLQVPVSIGNMSIGFYSIGFKDFKIRNPEYSTLPNALTVGDIAINCRLRNYFDTHVVIQEIVLSDIHLGLEFDSPSSVKGNWTRLMTNFENDTGEGTKNQNRTVLIKQLVLKNISVDLVYQTRSGKIKRLRPIDEIILTNITNTGGFPIDQIAESVLGQMLKSVFMKENLKNMLEGIIKNPPGTAKDLLKIPFKGVFK